MPSPFPGIDPYVEYCGRWQDFHSALLVYYRVALNEFLPEGYVAQVEEEASLMRDPGDKPPRPHPDVAVARDPIARRGGRQEQGRVGILEPVTIPLTTAYMEEVAATWIEIRKLPDLDLVTVIEVLSPTNKTGEGWYEYLKKRNGYIERPVHIVELDFLIAGHRLPMERPLPRGDFHAIVSHADRRPDADVYSWTIRDPLPAIPIPLEAPDPDVILDLAPPCAMAYDGGRYGMLLRSRYQEPLGLPLLAEDRIWAEGLAKEAIQA